MLQKVLCMVLVCCALAGCGQSTANLGKPVAVSGQVKLNGKPLTDVAVGFSAISKGMPAKYRYVSGVTDSEGAYAISDVFPGDYMVLLSEPDVAPNADNTQAAVVKVEAVAGNPKLAKYSTQSKLRAVVSAEATTHNFDATSP